MNNSTANEVAQRFGRDLVELRLRAGAPSYSALEKASKHDLKRATISDRLNGKRAGLPDWPFVFTFVTACRAVAEASGVDLEDLGTVADWKQRWDAAKRGIIDARFPGRSRQHAPLGQSSKAEPATTDLDELPQQRPSTALREGETVWGQVPAPINDFVGRERFLNDLRRRFMQDDRTGALTIQGVAGIGKTQLAAEYARRHRSEYDLVWWISCDTQDARRGMTELASRLGVAGSSWASGENQFTAVFDELRLSKRYAKWLLIFDGANDPEEIRKLIPPERQNVLITSRNYEWSATDNALELDVFERSESIIFLLQRRRGLSETEAHRLAEALGDLPLALEHAVESPFRVTEYLDRLESSALDLFSGNPPSAYPDSLTNTWDKAIKRLRKEAPDAMALLRSLAFFGSDPIPRESLERGGFNQAVSLHQILHDSIRLIRAISALRRMGFLSIRPGRRPDTNSLHVHRLTQCLVRDQLSADEAEQSRHDVHLLLVSAAPTNPDDSRSWIQYEELRGHLTASGAMGSRNTNVRLLIINFVRYLCATGDPKAALSLAHEALERWGSGVGTGGPSFGEIDLAMHRAQAEALCSLGSFHDAFEVYQSTLDIVRSVAAERPEEIIALGRIAGIRLRKEGDFATALTVDTESKEQHIAVLGLDHPQTFIAMHNLSVDHALNGNYVEAVDIAVDAYDRCCRFWDSDHPSTLFHQNACARYKRLSGEYDEALKMVKEVDVRYCSIAERKILREDHPWFLLHKIDFAAARRDMGLSGTDLEDLAGEIYHVYLRCWQTLGIDHPLTLAAAITRSSLLRRMRYQLNEAVELVTDTQRRYALTFGQSHPYTYACGTFLEGIRRQLSSAKDPSTQIERGSDFTPLPL